MTWDLLLSKPKEGKIQQIVALVIKEDLVDCCSLSTTDESVLETEKTKWFATQGWNVSRSIPVYKVLQKHRGVFPTEFAEPPTGR